MYALLIYLSLSKPYTPVDRPHSAPACSNPMKCAGYQRQPITTQRPGNLTGRR